MNKVSVKDLPLGQNKIENLKKIVVKSFKNNALMREIFATIKVEDSNKEVEFRKIGLNQITDRAWLTVDTEDSQIFWDYEMLGREYGKTIALSETKFIIERIIDECKDKCFFADVKILKEEDLLSVLNEFDIDFDSLMYNSKIADRFWKMDHFRWNHEERKGFARHEGTLFDMKTYLSNAVPVNRVLMFNSYNLAEILEKKAINLEIFEQLDENEILNKLPELKDEDIKEKIRILTFETIALRIKTPEELLMINI